ncbi:xanthine dehydrogenase small subunit, partial [Mycobacterium tuberculosis]|nr:xanthine dehydrogenase small subunit [Mycobacterium tuberculosis]
EYYRPERPTDSDHGPNGSDLHALSGNLCRCTGYRPIRDAAYALGDPTDDDALAARRSDPAPASAATDLHRPDTPTGELGRYRRPTRLAEAVEILSLEPDVLVVAGAT